MRNIQVREFQVDNDALDAMLSKAKNEERKHRAAAVSLRLEALANLIASNGMNAKEAAELLRREAIRFEHEAQELH
ncbi:DUF2732 family protein [Cedecea lapagei]|uniref:DUF2732 family protein n=1 Tax=Cedecea lapagei TaxID=158823 RepID=UPI001BCFAD50|nr:DUF2732 family protein [Cedecea lapagei]